MKKICTFSQLSPLHPHLINSPPSSNATNDHLLKKLIHTKLLSSSLDPSLNLTGAQRKKALEGRILELSSGAKLGKGEQEVREKERMRNIRRIRTGMKEKKDDTMKKELEEVCCFF